MTERGANTETATLAGGCFWCLEAVYQEVRGVRNVTSGYAGGSAPDPTYEQVCTGTTGHAEVVRIEFDPHEVSYEELLEIFFTIHDPTTLDRQGADIGPQYRSAIFYHSEQQQAAAKRVISDFEARRVWEAPIVTEVTPYEAFYPAEEYHANYYRRNPWLPYCRIVIEPKVAKLRKEFLSKLQA